MAERIKAMTGEISQVEARTLEQMQSLVGGLIDIVTGEDRIWVINDEGKINGLPMNPLATLRAVRFLFPGDFIAGDVIEFSLEEWEEINQEED